MNTKPLQKKRLSQGFTLKLLSWDFQHYFSLHLIRAAFAKTNLAKWQV